MGLEKKVLEAQVNQKACEQLMREYDSFITSCASKVTGKFVTKHDDEMSIALIAFHESIQKYEVQKGNFLSFAALIIRSRLIDYIRKERKTSDTVLFSSLSQNSKDGDEIEFDIEDTSKDNNDIRYELEALTEELKSRDISFLDLAKVSPKSKKTKLACFKVMNFVLSQPILIVELKKNNILPVKCIVDHVEVNRKVVERHRKYIIAGIIIITGNYEGMAEYFKGVKEVRI